MSPGAGMSAEAITAIIAALTALLGGLAGFIAKSRLPELITSGSDRETTAVNTMAGMLDKAIDGLVKMATSMERVGAELAGHERDSALRFQAERDLLTRILADVTAVSDRQRLLVRILSERKGRDG